MIVNKNSSRRYWMTFALVGVALGAVSPFAQADCAQPDPAEYPRQRFCLDSISVGINVSPDSALPSCTQGLTITNRARDLGFRFNERRGACTQGGTDSGQVGLSPGYFGECGDLRNVTISPSEADAVVASARKRTGTTTTRLSLRGINLRGAYVSNLVLSNIDLRDADLRGASLQNALAVSAPSIRRAQFDDRTQLPAGGGFSAMRTRLQMCDRRPGASLISNEQEPLIPMADDGTMIIQLNTNRNQPPARDSGVVGAPATTPGAPAGEARQ